MENLIITQKDLQCFGGFLQIIKQKNITEFGNYHIVLAGDFNEYTIDLFISDANKISKLYEKQFFAITFPLMENIRAAGKNQYAKLHRNILFTKKFFTKEGKIKQTRFLDEDCAAQNNFKNQISTNLDLGEKLFECHNVFSMENYWKFWYEQTLKIAMFANHTGTFENLVTPNADGKFYISTTEDLYDYLYQFFYLRNRIGIVGYGEFSDYVPDELVFMIDSNPKLETEVRYAIIKKHNNKITLQYAPLYLSLDVEFSYLRYFPFVMQNIFENLQTHIDAVIKQAEKDEKQILIKEAISKITNPVKVDEDEDATNNFCF